MNLARDRRGSKHDRPALFAGLGTRENGRTTIRLPISPRARPCALDPSTPSTCFLDLDLALDLDLLFSNFFNPTS